MAPWAACLFHIFPALCLGLLPGTCLSLQAGRPRSPTCGRWWAPGWPPVSSLSFLESILLKVVFFLSFFFLPLFTSCRQRFHSTPYHPCRTLSWNFADQNGFQCYETTARCCHFASRVLLPSDLTDLLWQGVNLTSQGDCSRESCWFSPRQSSEVSHKLKTNTFFLRSQYTYCNTIPLHTNTKVSVLLNVTSKPQWGMGYVLLKSACQLSLQVSSVVKESTCNARDTVDTSSIPGLGRGAREGNGNPLQYSCLGNPMDRAAWRATVHGAAKSQD